MVGWHHWLNGHELEQTLGDSEGQGSLACCGPWDHKSLDMTLSKFGEIVEDREAWHAAAHGVTKRWTQLSNWTTTTAAHIVTEVKWSRSVVSSSVGPHGLQHTRLPCPSLSPAVCSSSCPLSQWCHPTISSSVIPFSSCFQYSNIKYNFFKKN